MEIDDRGFSLVSGISGGLLLLGNVLALLLDRSRVSFVRSGKRAVVGRRASGVGLYETTSSFSRASAVERKEQRTGADDVLGVIGDDGLGSNRSSVGRRVSEPENGSNKEMVPSDGCTETTSGNCVEIEEQRERTVILLDDLCSDEGEPEDSGEQRDDSSGTADGSGDTSLRKFVQTERRRSLED